MYEHQVDSRDPSFFIPSLAPSLFPCFQLNYVNESHTVLPEMIRIRKSYFDHIMSYPKSRISMSVILGDVNGHSCQGNSVETLNTCSHVNTVKNNYRIWHLRSFECFDMFSLSSTVEKGASTPDWTHRCPQIRDLPHIPEQCSGACPCGWSECTSRCSCASSDFGHPAALVARPLCQSCEGRDWRSPSVVNADA